MADKVKWLNDAENLLSVAQIMVKRAAVLIYLGEETEMTTEDFSKHVMGLHQCWHDIDDAMDYLHSYRHEMEEKERQQ